MFELSRPHIGILFGTVLLFHVSHLLVSSLISGPERFDLPFSALMVLDKLFLNCFVSGRLMMKSNKAILGRRPIQKAHPALLTFLGVSGVPHIGFFHRSEATRHGRSQLRFRNIQRDVHHAHSPQTSFYIYSVHVCGVLDEFSHEKDLIFKYEFSAQYFLEGNTRIYL